MSRFHNPRGQTIDFGGLQGPPVDIKALLVVLFVLFSAAYVPALQPLTDNLHLQPNMFETGFLWQLVTYVVAQDPGGIWFLLSMLILFQFGRDVFRMLGRRRFWWLVASAAVSASLVAMAVIGALQLMGWAVPLGSLLLMRSNRMLLAILVAAFATLYPNASIRLFFVLPVRARSFLWIEILLAFIFGLLEDGDLAGFLGICIAVGMTYAMLTGGLRRNLRELRLRFERWWIEQRLKRMKKRRGFRVVKPDEGGDVRRGPWVH